MRARILSCPPPSPRNKKQKAARLYWQHPRKQPVLRLILLGEDTASSILGKLLMVSPVRLVFEMHGYIPMSEPNMA